jgi:hypothetical protein
MRYKYPDTYRTASEPGGEVPIAGNSGTAGKLIESVERIKSNV